MTQPNDRDREVAREICRQLRTGGRPAGSERIASYREEIIRECAAVVSGYSVVSGLYRGILNEYNRGIEQHILSLLDSEEAE